MIRRGVSHGGLSALSASQNNSTHRSWEGKCVYIPNNSLFTGEMRRGGGRVAGGGGENPKPAYQLTSPQGSAIAKSSIFFNLMYFSLCNFVL